MDFLTSASMASDDSAAESSAGRSRLGLDLASGGNSHSCVTPTSDGPSPSAYAIVVPEGRKLATRSGGEVAASDAAVDVDAMVTG
jgi:hypothetical protein